MTIDEVGAYYGRERFFLIFSLGQNRGFSHFVLHVKRRGPKVKQPFNLYWWAELNFGQDPVFFKSIRI